MYLTRLKTLLVDAVQQTFDASYPIPEFRGIHASIEFPIKKADYPAVWVDYNPQGPYTIAGIGHIEYDSDEGETVARGFTRWKFQGEASFTLVAMTSFERDRLHDEFVRVLAFGRENPGTSDFRDLIEDNEWLGVNFDWDEISVRGMTQTVGTPWQTDDIVYEVEIAMECIGDFVSDSQNKTLIPLSEVRVHDYTEIDEADPEFDPNFGGEGAWE